MASAFSCTSQPHLAAARSGSAPWVVCRQLGHTRGQKCCATKERVLRYPDGHERRILYPAVHTMDEEDASHEHMDVGEWWAAGSSTSAAQQRRQPAFASSSQALAPAQGSSSAPSLDTAAFLEGLFAASYAAQPLIDVEDSYQVLGGCPWLLPRPVFVLTSQDWGWQAADGIQSAYTLRVKSVQEGAADAIAQLLKKQHLSGSLEVAQMRDGLVVFESADDADKFACMLEEEGHSQVMVAEVDSHKVFRMVSDAKGLAVLLLEGASIPAPYQLAASLKKQQSLDAL